MELRHYHPDDLSQLARLYHDTIHLVNRGDYTQAQVDAWAPVNPELERLRQKLAEEEVIVAEIAGDIVGFCSWDNSGHLDFLYVHHAHQRKGIASALYLAAEKALGAKGLSRIHTQASITAQPFFLRQGFRLVQRQTVHVRGVDLPNTVMEKVLA